MKEIIHFFGQMLPFLRNSTPRELTEFTDLVKNQYSYLLEIIERFQKDYFLLAEQLKEMNQEIINLNKELKEAMALQCADYHCSGRM